MPKGLRRAAAAPPMILAVILCGGCGLGSGPGSGAVTLTVTRDFGSRRVAAITRAGAAGSATVLGMLERALKVSTGRRGRVVTAIDGLSAAGSGQAWSYYVNGVQQRSDPADAGLHRNDHVWWDLHDVGATSSIPAVVGSFPEPFVNGFGGVRYPTTLECGGNVARACAIVTAELERVHVPVASQLAGTGSGSDTLGLDVGTWRQLAPEVAAELVAYGPGASGVFVRFAGRGRTMLLLGPGGQVARELGSGAGLIAATADSSSAPTWLITGTDVAGVTAAARAFTAAALHDHFALAVSGGRRIPLPVQGGG